MIMIDDTQRDELAAKLLGRGLVKTHDEALELAGKFLEMETSSSPDTPSEPTQSEPAVIGDALESAPAAQNAYANVLYYEQLKLEPKGQALTMRVETRDEPAQAPPPPAREQSTIDISQMFNVANMRKAQES
jgi:hypothetical protein